jgi:hypothetical protein
VPEPPAPPPPPPPPPPEPEPEFVAEEGSTPSQPAQPAPPSDKPIETPAGPPAVTVFQEVPPSPEELAREAGVEPEGDHVSSGSQGIVEPPPELPEAAEPEVEEPEAAEPEVVEPEPEPAHTTAAVRQEYDAGRLVAIEIEEDGAVTRIVRGDDGWSVHPG